MQDLAAPRDAWPRSKTLSGHGSPAVARRNGTAPPSPPPCATHEEEESLGASCSTERVSTIVCLTLLCGVIFAAAAAKMGEALRVIV
jgi:hypothetical protein